MAIAVARIENRVSESVFPSCVRQRGGEGKWSSEDRCEGLLPAKEAETESCARTGDGGSAVA